MLSKQGLGLNEVLLVPSASDVLPNEIDIRTQVTQYLQLSVPIIGATNFTTVDHALAFAKAGTLAILPETLATPIIVEKMKQIDTTYLVGVSINLSASMITRVHELVTAGINVLQLPTTTQQTSLLMRSIHDIKKQFPTLPVWVGPTDSLKDAQDALEAGADTIIVGNNNHPLTNIVTTVMAFTALAAKFDKNVILGSGVKYSGDVVKALAAGAVATMVDDQMMTGVIADNIFQISGSLRSGMGYTGSGDVATLRQHGQFVQITAAGLTESHPHDVTLIRDAPNYHHV